MDLSNFIELNQVRTVGVPYLSLTSKKSISPNVECSRFFEDKGVSRARILVSKDYKVVAIVPTDKNQGVVVRHGKKMCFNNRFLRDMLDSMFPTDKGGSVKFKGRFEDNAIVFELKEPIYY